MDTYMHKIMYAHVQILTRMLPTTLTTSHSLNQTPYRPIISRNNNTGYHQMEPRQQEGEDKDGEDADKQAEVKGGGGGRPQPRNSVGHVNSFR